MDKSGLICLAALARVDGWSDTGTTVCPFCGKSWNDGYGHVTPRHEEDCPVKQAREILEANEIYV
jgi:hypothetical protein